MDSEKVVYIDERRQERRPEYVLVFRYETDAVFYKVFGGGFTEVDNVTVAEALEAIARKMRGDD